MPDLSPEPIESDELRCPTCGARQGWSDTCRRCRSDLSLLLLLAQQWRRCRRQALAALSEGRSADAVELARRCHEIAPGSQSRRLLAVCHLLHEDWPAALAAASPLLVQQAQQGGEV